MSKSNDIEIDLRQEENTPLFFKFMARAKVVENPTPSKANIIEVDYYQTNSITPFGHYKPISKILTWHYGRNGDAD